MLQLDDLHDDCLMEVLEQLPPEQLFKMLGINKRMNRLAAIKIRVKIKAIQLSDFRYYRNFGFSFPDCNQLHDITQNQVLVCSIFKKSEDLYQPSKQALFLNLLTKCDNIKSIDFFCDTFSDKKELPKDFLMEAVRRCPDIECLKIELVEQDEWSRVLDLIGNKIIHFEKVNGNGVAISLLKMIVQKCPNLRRVDWRKNKNVTSDLLTVLKTLPKCCQVNLSCSQFDVFEDFFDKIQVYALDWSLLPTRVRRLSSLSGLSGVNALIPPNGPVFGVDFASLKKLQLNCKPTYSFSSKIISCLVASRFPLLEELRFNAASCCFSENDYEALFQRMTTVKKLYIYCWNMEYDPLLPGSAIHHLKTLETIHLDILRSPTDWQPNDFLQQLEQYVDEIKSLKKLRVEVDYFPDTNWAKMMNEKVRRLKKKGRVEVVLFRNYFGF